MGFILFCVFASLALLFGVPAVFARVRGHKKIIVLADVRPAALPASGGDSAVSEYFRRQEPKVKKVLLKHNPGDLVLASAPGRFEVTSEPHMIEHFPGAWYQSVYPYRPIMVKYCLLCGVNPYCANCTPDLAEPACYQFAAKNPRACPWDVSRNI